MKKPLTPELLAGYAAGYRADRERQLASRAFARADVAEASFAPEESFGMKHTFSIDIKTLPAANQERSGRCWLFAATNVLRERIANRLNLESFELSQSYLAFWDKFERANYFLESILETAGEPTDERNVAFILATGVHDGGQWEMFSNIVRKYGVVPKDIYNETYQSSHTGSMNAVLNQNLKKCAAILRNMARSGRSEEALEAEKEKMLAKVYSFLVSCYTEPPKTFDFEYADKDGAYHVERGMTPLSFAEKYVGDLLEKTVSIINAPTADKEFGKTYTIRHLGNIVGGKPVVHLNLAMDEFKEAILNQLKDGKVVWFGSDCGKYAERNRGFWNDRSFDLELTTGLDLALTKAEGLDYGYSAMNHAMCLTGVDLVDGKPVRWKVENSWGEKSGEKGYYVASDSWFDRFVYQAAVEEEYPGEKAALAKAEPIVLEAWDPMGTLAD